MEGLGVADADRAQRVAVVRLGERDEARAPRLAAQLPVLERQLERDLDRGGAGVGVEDARQRRRRQLDQPLGQHRRRHVGEAEHGGVRDPVALRLERLVELALAVAVHVAPQRRDAVEVAPAVGVDQVVALAALDDQRRLGEPVAHLGERMPEVLVIPGHQLGRARSASWRRTSGAGLPCPCARSARTAPNARSPRRCRHRVCVAMTVARMRAVPSGTVGGRMPCAKTPLLEQRRRQRHGRARRRRR